MSVKAKKVINVICMVPHIQNGDLSILVILLYLSSLKYLCIIKFHMALHTQYILCTDPFGGFTLFAQAQVLVDLHNRLRVIRGSLVSSSWFGAFRVIMYICFGIV